MESIVIGNYSDDNATVTTPISGNILTRNMTILDQQSYQIGVGIITWYLPIIIIVGTVGNLITFIIMMRREMRHTPTSFYLAALAIADTTMLYLSGLKTWIRTITGYELLHVSNAGCKVVTFIVHFSLPFSGWLIVAVTIERFLAVWFPLKANTMCSMSRAMFVTVMIAMTFILINVHIFWTAELVKGSANSDAVYCTAYAYKNFVCTVFPWIDLILYSFLPFIILLIFNSLIIVSLVRNKGIFSHLTREDRMSRIRHHKLAVTLLVISFAWILTTIPRPLFNLFTPKPSSLEENANQFLGKVICFMLMYTNHAINFFLYCLTGQRFRLEFTKFMCQWRQKKEPLTPRLTFKSSVSTSTGPDTSSSFPLMTTPIQEMANFD